MIAKARSPFNAEKCEESVLKNPVVEVTNSKTESSQGCKGEMILSQYEALGFPSRIAALLQAGKWTVARSAENVTGRKHPSILPAVNRCDLTGDLTLRVGDGINGDSIHRWPNSFGD